MQQPPAPFSCTFTPNVPELLRKLQCTLAISTYQAGKLIFISAINDEQLVQLPRQFDKAMGIAFDGKRLALATKNEIIVLADGAALAKEYPVQPHTYDHLFIPRATYYTGPLDIHDLSWTSNGLVGVNTQFSCLSKVSDTYNFEPLWSPSFISDLIPEDRCHLNGMAIKDGKPLYATALGKTDHLKGWRESIETGGLVMHVGRDEIVAHSLPMPHSPQIFDEDLYILCSATGELRLVDTNSGTTKTVLRLNGFVRGMDKKGDYLFIGMSRIRQNTSVFRNLPIAQKATQCGVAIVHLPTASLAGHITYASSVEEIYDIKILSNMIRPGILNPSRSEHRQAIVTPQDSFWAISRNEQNTPRDSE